MISYRKGYKYQLAKTYRIDTNIKQGKDAPNITTNFIMLHHEGRLRILNGYAWDGPSGPTIDTPNFMTASLVHDALYQLMRMGKLDIKWREQADKELRRICLAKGMTKIRAWYVYNSVRLFAKGAALPENKKEILTAP